MSSFVWYLIISFSCFVDNSKTRWALAAQKFYRTLLKTTTSYKVKGAAGGLFWVILYFSAVD